MDGLEDGAQLTVSVGYQDGMAASRAQTVAYTLDASTPLVNLDVAQPGAGEAIITGGTEAGALVYLSTPAGDEIDRGKSRRAALHSYGGGRRVPDGGGIAGRSKKRNRMRIARRRV